MANLKFVFNPITGNLDLVNKATGTPVSGAVLGFKTGSSSVVPNASGQVTLVGINGTTVTGSGDVISISAGGGIKIRDSNGNLVSPDSNEAFTFESSDGSLNIVSKTASHALDFKVTDYDRIALLPSATQPTPSSVPFLTGADNKTLDPSGVTIGGRDANELHVGALHTKHALEPRYGGTGADSYAGGDILYGQPGGDLAKLPIGAPGTVLTASTLGKLYWGTGGSGSGGVAPPSSDPLPNSIPTFSSRNTLQITPVTLDSTGSMDGVNNLDVIGRLSAHAIESNVPISTSSGGTGRSSYPVGSLLYGGGGSLLNILNIGNPGDVLGVYAGGLRWAPAGNGDVIGPDFSTVSSVPVFSDTTGKRLKPTNALIDADGNMHGLKSIASDSASFGQALPSTSGGTGFKQFSIGEILMGDVNGLLSKLPAASKDGLVLTSTSTGAGWFSPSPISADVISTAKNTLEDQVAIFTDTGGKTIKNTIVTMDAQGNIDNVKTLFATGAVSCGSLGVSSLSADSLIFVDASKNVTSFTPLKDGQLVVGVTGGAPAAGGIVGDSQSITVTFDPATKMFKCGSAGVLSALEKLTDSGFLHRRADGSLGVSAITVAPGLTIENGAGIGGPPRIGIDYKANDSSLSVALLDDADITTQIGSWHHITGNAVTVFKNNIDFDNTPDWIATSTVSGKYYVQIKAQITFTHAAAEAAGDLLECSVDVLLENSIESDSVASYKIQNTKKAAAGTAEDFSSFFYTSEVIELDAGAYVTPTVRVRTASPAKLSKILIVGVEAADPSLGPSPINRTMLSLCRVAVPVGGSSTTSAIKIATQNGDVVPSPTGTVNIIGEGVNATSASGPNSVAVSSKGTAEGQIPISGGTDFLMSSGSLKNNDGYISTVYTAPDLVQSLAGKARELVDLHIGTKAGLLAKDSSGNFSLEEISVTGGLLTVNGTAIGLTAAAVFSKLIFNTKSSDGTVTGATSPDSSATISFKDTPGSPLHFKSGTSELSADLKSTKTGSILFGSNGVFREGLLDNPDGGVAFGVTTGNPGAPVIRLLNNLLQVEKLAANGFAYKDHDGGVWRTITLVGQGGISLDFSQLKTTGVVGILGGNVDSTETSTVDGIIPQYSGTTGKIIRATTIRTNDFGDLTGIRDLTITRNLKLPNALSAAQGGTGFVNFNNGDILAGWNGSLTRIGSGEVGEVLKVIAQDQIGWAKESGGGGTGNVKSVATVSEPGQVPIFSDTTGHSIDKSALKVEGKSVSGIDNLLHDGPIHISPKSAGATTGLDVHGSLTSNDLTTDFVTTKTVTATGDSSFAGETIFSGLFRSKGGALFTKSVFFPEILENPNNEYLAAVTGPDGKLVGVFIEDYTLLSQYNNKMMEMQITARTGDLFEFVNKRDAASDRKLISELRSIGILNDLSLLAKGTVSGLLAKSSSGVLGLGSISVGTGLSIDNGDFSSGANAHISFTGSGVAQQVGASVQITADYDVADGDTDNLTKNYAVIFARDVQVSDPTSGDRLTFTIATAGTYLISGDLYITFKSDNTATNIRSKSRFKIIVTKVSTGTPEVDTYRKGISGDAVGASPGVLVFDTDLSLSQIVQLGVGDVVTFSFVSDTASTPNTSVATATVLGRGASFGNYKTLISISLIDPKVVKEGGGGSITILPQTGGSVTPNLSDVVNMNGLGIVYTERDPTNPNQLNIRLKGRYSYNFLGVGTQAEGYPVQEIGLNPAPGSGIFGSWQTSTYYKLDTSPLFRSLQAKSTSTASGYLFFDHVNTGNPLSIKDLQINVSPASVATVTNDGTLQFNQRIADISNFNTGTVGPLVATGGRIVAVALPPNFDPTSVAILANFNGKWEARALKATSTGINFSVDHEGSVRLDLSHNLHALESIPDGKTGFFYRDGTNAIIPIDIKGGEGIAVDKSKIRSEGAIYIKVSGGGDTPITPIAPTEDGIPDVDDDSATYIGLKVTADEVPSLDVSSNYSTINGVKQWNVGVANVTTKTSQSSFGGSGGAFSRSQGTYTSSYLAVTDYNGASYGDNSSFGKVCRLFFAPAYSSDTVLIPSVGMHSVAAEPNSNEHIYKAIWGDTDLDVPESADSATSPEAVAQFLLDMIMLEAPYSGIYILEASFSFSGTGTFLATPLPSIVGVVIARSSNVEITIPGTTLKDLPIDIVRSGAVPIAGGGNGLSVSSRAYSAGFGFYSEKTQVYLNAGDSIYFGLSSGGDHTGYAVNKGTKVEMQFARSGYRPFEEAFPDPEAIETDRFYYSRIESHTNSAPLTIPAGTPYIPKLGALISKKTPTGGTDMIDSNFTITPSGKSGSAVVVLSMDIYILSTGSTTAPAPMQVDLILSNPNISFESRGKCSICISPNGRVAHLYAKREIPIHGSGTQHYKISFEFSPHTDITLSNSFSNVDSGDTAQTKVTSLTPKILVWELTESYTPVFGGDLPTMDEDDPTYTGVYVASDETPGVTNALNVNQFLWNKGVPAVLEGSSSLSYILGPCASTVGEKFPSHTVFHYITHPMDTEYNHGQVHVGRLLASTAVFAQRSISRFTCYGISSLTATSKSKPSQYNFLPSSRGITGVGGNKSYFTISDTQAQNHIVIPKTGMYLIRGKIGTKPNFASDANRTSIVAVILSYASGGKHDEFRSRIAPISGYHFGFSQGTDPSGNAGSSYYEESRQVYLVAGDHVIPALSTPNLTTEVTRDVNYQSSHAAAIYSGTSFEIEFLRLGYSPYEEKFPLVNRRGSVKYRYVNLQSLSTSFTVSRDRQYYEFGSIGSDISVYTPPGELPLLNDVCQIIPSGKRDETINIIFMSDLYFYQSESASSSPVDLLLEIVQDGNVLYSTAPSVCSDDRSFVHVFWKGQVKFSSGSSHPVTFRLSGLYSSSVGVNFTNDFSNLHTSSGDAVKSVQARIMVYDQDVPPQSAGLPDINEDDPSYAGVVLSDSEDPGATDDSNVYADSHIFWGNGIPGNVQNVYGGLPGQNAKLVGLPFRPQAALPISDTTIVKNNTLGFHPDDPKIVRFISSPAAWTDWSQSNGSSGFGCAPGFNVSETKNSKIGYYTASIVSELLDDMVLSCTGVTGDWIGVYNSTLRKNNRFVAPKSGIYIFKGTFVAASKYQPTLLRQSKASQSILILAQNSGVDKTVTFQNGGDFTTKEIDSHRVRTLGISGYFFGFNVLGIDKPDISGIYKTTSQVYLKAGDIFCLGFTAGFDQDSTQPPHEDNEISKNSSATTTKQPIEFMFSVDGYIPYQEKAPVPELLWDFPPKYMEVSLNQITAGTSDTTINSFASQIKAKTPPGDTPLINSQCQIIPSNREGRIHIAFMMDVKILSTHSNVPVARIEIYSDQRSFVKAAASVQSDDGKFCHLYWEGSIYTKKDEVDPIKVKVYFADAPTGLTWTNTFTGELVQGNNISSYSPWLFACEESYPVKPQADLPAIDPTSDTYFGVELPADDMVVSSSDDANKSPLNPVFFGHGIPPLRNVVYGGVPERAGKLVGSSKRPDVVSPIPPNTQIQNYVFDWFEDFYMFDRLIKPFFGPAAWTDWSVNGNAGYGMMPGFTGLNSMAGSHNALYDVEITSAVLDDIVESFSIDAKALNSVYLAHLLTKNRIIIPKTGLYILHGVFNLSKDLARSNLAPEGTMQVLHFALDPATQETITFEKAGQRNTNYIDFKRCRCISIAGRGQQFTKFNQVTGNVYSQNYSGSVQAFFKQGDIIIPGFSSTGYYFNNVAPSDGADDFVRHAASVLSGTSFQMQFVKDNFDLYVQGVKNPPADCKKFKSIALNPVSVKSDDPKSVNKFDGKAKRVIDVLTPKGEVDLINEADCSIHPSLGRASTLNITFNLDVRVLSGDFKAPTLSIASTAGALRQTYDASTQASVVSSDGNVMRFFWEFSIRIPETDNESRYMYLTFDGLTSQLIYTTRFVTVVDGATIASLESWLSVYESESTKVITPTGDLPDFNQDDPSYAGIRVGATEIPDRKVLANNQSTIDRRFWGVGIPMYDSSNSGFPIKFQNPLESGALYAAPSQSSVADGVTCYAHGELLRPFIGSAIWPLDFPATPTSIIYYGSGCGLTSVVAMPNSKLTFYNTNISSEFINDAFWFSAPSVTIFDLMKPSVYLRKNAFFIQKSGIYLIRAFIFKILEEGKDDLNACQEGLVVFIGGGNNALVKDESINLKSGGTISAKNSAAARIFRASGTHYPVSFSDNTTEFKTQIYLEEGSFVFPGFTKPVLGAKFVTPDVSSYEHSRPISDKNTFELQLLREGYRPFLNALSTPPENSLYQAVQYKDTPEASHNKNSVIFLPYENFTISPPGSGNFILESNSRIVLQVNTPKKITIEFFGDFLFESTDGVGDGAAFESPRISFYGVSSELTSIPGNFSPASIFFTNTNKVGFGVICKFHFKCSFSTTLLGPPGSYLLRLGLTTFGNGFTAIKNKFSAVSASDPSYIYESGPMQLQVIQEDIETPAAGIPDVDPADESFFGMKFHEDSLTGNDQDDPARYITSSNPSSPTDPSFKLPFKFASTGIFGNTEVLAPPFNFKKATECALISYGYDNKGVPYSLSSTGASPISCTTVPYLNFKLKGAIKSFLYNTIDSRFGASSYLNLTKGSDINLNVYLIPSNVSAMAIRPWFSYMNRAISTRCSSISTLFEDPVYLNVVSSPGFKEVQINTASSSSYSFDTRSKEAFLGDFSVETTTLNAIPSLQICDSRDSTPNPGGVVLSATDYIPYLDWVYENLSSNQMRQFVVPKDGIYIFDCKFLVKPTGDLNSDKNGWAMPCVLVTITDKDAEIKNPIEPANISSSTKCYIEPKNNSRMIKLCSQAGSLSTLDTTPGAEKLIMSEKIQAYLRQGEKFSISVGCDGGLLYDTPYSTVYFDDIGVYAGSYINFAVTREGLYNPYTEEIPPVSKIPSNSDSWMFVNLSDINTSVPENTKRDVEYFEYSYININSYSSVIDKKTPAGENDLLDSFCAVQDPGGFGHRYSVYLIMDIQIDAEKSLTVDELPNGFVLELYSDQIASHPSEIIYRYPVPCSSNRFSHIYYAGSFYKIANDGPVMFRIGFTGTKSGFTVTNKFSNAQDSDTSVLNSVSPKLLIYRHPLT